MAVVMEMKARNGATIRFLDDDYALCGPEEIRRRQRRVAEGIVQIAEDMLRKMPPEARPAFLERIKAPDDALPPEAWLG